MKNNKMLIFLFSTLSIVLSGCDSNKNRSDIFKDTEYVIFTHDSTGEKWAIKHHVGDNYTLKKCDDVFKGSISCKNNPN